MNDIANDATAGVRPPDIDYRGYRLANVHGRLDPATAQAIMGLWLLNNVVTPAEAQRRVNEVVYAVRNPAGELVGVNTVYTAARPGDGATYYLYRTFIRPRDRGVAGLPQLMLRLTIEYLRGLADEKGPVGLVIVTENPKLMRRGMSALARRMGLSHLGKDSRGCDVWGLHFDGGEPSALVNAK